jgi:hypothetical protein
VDTKKNILIVTDGGESIQKTALKIADQLTGSQVFVLTTPDLSGTDVLSAEIYFFGCEKPHPPSFAYLEELLRHINLVGRRCGVFSVQSKTAVKYLADLVHESELVLSPEPFFGDGETGLAEWIKTVLG